MCHKIPQLCDKAALAGCKKVFIGLENINPESLKGSSKDKIRSPNTARCSRPGRESNVLTYAGYILGFPSDTPESIERDIKIIQRELPIDILEFFMLTPPPGSKDHQEMYLKGERLEADTEQIRRGACHRQSSPYDRGPMGRYLPARLASLLHPEPYRNASTSSGRQRHPDQPNVVHDLLLLRDPGLRGRSPTARRNSAAQMPNSAQAGLRARKPAPVHVPSSERSGDDVRPGIAIFLAPPTTEETHRKRSRGQKLHRCRTYRRR